MKKRAAAVLLGIVMAVTTACSSGQAGNTENSRNESGSASATSSAKQESSSKSHSDGKYYVGIIAQKDLDSMSETVEGLRTQLESKYGDNVRFDYVCANGSDDKYDEALTRFVNDGDDVIVAVGTEALEHAAAATSKIPIVAACITDFLSTGLINSEDQPGGNITGVTDFPPVEQQAAMITNYFVTGGSVSDEYVGGYAGSSDSSADTALYASIETENADDRSSDNRDSGSGDSDNQVGILYTSDDKGSEFTARVMDKYLTADSVSWKNYKIADADDIEKTVRKACDECSVIYLPADVTLADNMADIRQITLDENIPVITAESTMCAAGGLATYSIDYTEEGETAADMVSDIIDRNNSQKSDTSSGGASTDESEEESKKGNPEKMEIQNVTDSASYLYNPVTAQELGWSNRGVFRELEDRHEESSGGSTESSNPGTGTRTYSDTSSDAEE